VIDGVERPDGVRTGRAPARRVGALLSFALVAPLAARPDAGEKPRAADAPPAGAAQAIPSQLGTDVDPEVDPGPDPTVLAALERGLAYLAARQGTQEDGSLPQDEEARFVPVAVTALASLAWMAAGSQPDRGPYGEEIVRAIDYLVRSANVTPTSDTYGYITDGGPDGRIHAHGFATLALSQAYSMSPRTVRGKKIARVLEAGVRLIENAQVHEGGWYYEPRRTLQHENSTTICVVQALRAARNAGIRVDPAVIARAIDYVKRTQNDDGGFRYGLDQDQTTIAITAAAVATLNATGEYTSREITTGIQWMLARLELRAEEEAESPRTHRLQSLTSFPYYERLYVAQALWQNPDRRLFERWWDRERTRILAAQDADGSWESRRFGSSYATAVNCLVLALPLELLPIFQR